MRRVLLVGATGAFGERLARGLTQVPALDVILTSRSLTRAQALVDALRPCARCAAITALAFTRTQDDARTFETLRPWLVIDASGPFQSAGYGTARAAIKAGAHWIDLADAADYVIGFAAALDAPARRNGVAAIAGASSTPALSYAAAEMLTRDWSGVETIDIAIYPGGDAQVGRAVLEAVLSYAGSPVAIWKDNKPATVMGWGVARRTRIPELGVRYRAPVATSDAAILPVALGAANVAFHAGLESRLEQFGLVALARLRAAGWLTNPARLAPLLYRARAMTRIFARDTGGMTVTATGHDARGALTSTQWLLVAHNGDGPSVPVLPALATVRRMLVSRIAPGARHAAGLLALATIEAEMTPYALTTLIRTLPQAAAPGSSAVTSHCFNPR